MRSRKDANYLTLRLRDFAFLLKKQNMFRNIFLLLFISIPFLLSAQKVKTESGEFTMRVETNMSEDQAKLKCRELAQINAIENAFGKVVFQGNSTYIQNTNGDKTETTNVFNFMADSYVNGEWLKTEDEKVEYFNEKDGSRWIKITIEGRIREKIMANPSFIIYPLTCPALNCKATFFNNGQNFYLYYKGAATGYISVFFDDPNTKETFRILPYTNSKNQVCFPVKADNEYFLFSNKHNYTAEADIIDELELEAITSMDQYKIYVLFSPQPFDKPILNNKTNQVLQKKAIDEGYTSPKSMNSEAFQAWLQNIRIANSTIEMQTTYISVNK